MPRYFTDGTDSWEWDGCEMWIILSNGSREESLFISPEEILSVFDVIETDEDGCEVPESSEDVAAAKGAREQQRIADMS